MVDKNILNTVLKLSKSVKTLRNKEGKIGYEEFFDPRRSDKFYQELGAKLIDLIETNKAYESFKILDYDWVIDNSHPLANYSPMYRELKQKESKYSKLNIVDLFCGAGGLSLGFVQNGFEVSLANDIDDSCIYTYTHNHPSVPQDNILLGDINSIIKDIGNYVRFENTDVVVGGPPCQGFSMANRQRIKDDPRNKLYKYFIEAVKTLKPKVFVMENVKGMRNVAEQVVEDFLEIGYFTSFEVLNAKDYSVPQNRERLIFIGTKNAKDSEKIFESIKTSSSKYNHYVLQDALFGLPELQASTKKNATNAYDNSGGLVMPISENNTNEYIDLINNGKMQYVILNGKARYNNDRDIEIYRRLHQGDDSTDIKIKDIMPYKSRSHIFKDKYYKLKENEVCKTITAHMKYDCNMYIHPRQARGLTPRETARIQSFPDDYFFQGPYTKTYMQIGNSVPPLLGKVISEAIRMYLRR